MTTKKKTNKKLTKVNLTDEELEVVNRFRAKCGDSNNAVKHLKKLKSTAASHQQKASKLTTQLEKLLYELETLSEETGIPVTFFEMAYIPESYYEAFGEDFLLPAEVIEELDDFLYSIGVNIPTNYEFSTWNEETPIWF